MSKRFDYMMKPPPTSLKKTHKLVLNVFGFEKRPIDSDLVVLEKYCTCVGPGNMQRQEFFWAISLIGPTAGLCKLPNAVHSSLGQCFCFDGPIFFYLVFGF